MAKLPVYTNGSNISVHQPISTPDNPMFQAANSLAETTKNVALQWQQTQNAAETLDGKNKLVAQTTDILNKAESYNDYKNPAELQAKEKEMLGELEGVLANVSSGFTNERNAAEFNGQYQLTVAENAQKLKSIFRGKYIDNAKANLAMSYDNNFNSFISSGNSAYKNSYVSDVDNMFKAGYIDAEEKTNRLLKVKEWDFSRASNDVITDPDGVLGNLKNYSLTPENQYKIVKAATTQIEQKKLFAGFSALVEKGTEGNRLYNKYLEDGLSLSEIQENPTISDSEKTALMKLSGYDTATFKQGKKNADSITKQLELDEKMKTTIKGTSERPKLAKDKEIKDLLSLREEVYDMLLSGDITKEKATKYFNQVIGASLREAKNLADTEDKEGRITNPYAEGLIQIDEKLTAQGIDNDKIKAGTHNLYFEAMSDLLEKGNPEGKSWSSLPDKTKLDMQNKALSYAMANVPNVAEAKEMFSYYLPASKRKVALDSFMSRYNPEMTDAQRKELAKEITIETGQKTKAETDMSIANATYDFSNDSEFLEKEGITQEDVVFTAQKYGMSVQEVLQKYKEIK